MAKAEDKPRVLPVQTGKPLPRIVPWNDKGRELLKKGNRKSIENTKEGGEIPDLDFLMHAMNINLNERREDNSKKKKPKNIDIRSREERLRGLFGGNR